MEGVHNGTEGKIGIITKLLEMDCKQLLKNMLDKANDQLQRCFLP